MLKITAYLVLWVVVLGILFTVPITVGLPEWAAPFKLFYLCCLSGGIGGCLYCLRAVYINASVKGEWSRKWEIWYYIRPLVSLISGGASYLFLKAGLLVLESQEVPGSTNYGFLALAFIAGLNVDNFVKKIESIAESAWGISKSRTATEGEKD